jgi:pyruvate/2-oxoglutarate dehydrogenase complex dihydrolipoamide acyltransferase (E2) component
MFLSVNKSMKTPIVEGDKIVIGETMNCNFTVDHRYIDGGKCVGLIPQFRKVFEQP